MGKRLLSTIAPTVLFLLCSLPVSSSDNTSGYKAPNNIIINWGESYKAAYKKLQKLQYKWGINHENKSFEITDNKTFPNQSNEPGGAVLVFEENGFSHVTFGNLSSYKWGINQKPSMLKVVVTRISIFVLLLIV